jgi:hypothetical protein
MKRKQKITIKPRKQEKDKARKITKEKHVTEISTPE